MDARPLGGHWTRDGVIVYASTEGLFSVPVDGGEPELLAAPDPEAGELYYAWPQVLPGSGDILFTLLPLGADTDDEGVIAVLDPETGEHTVVLRGGAGAMYRSERIFFTRNSELHALAFDPATATARGDEVPLTIEDIAVSRGLGPSFDLSGDGTLVYVPSAAPPNRELVWVDAAGQEEPLGAPALRYVYPRISHDGTRIVVDVSGDNRDLYVWDVARRSLSRLTEHPAEDFFGAWGPNGQVVYFTSNRSGAFNVYSRRADGTGTVQPVLESDGTQMLNGLTPDGRQLLVSQRQGALDFDLATIPMVGATTADVILATNNNESMAAVSPDGRWVAYQSDVSGEFEVYVGPFPEADQRRWKVSIDGGLHPHWSEDGSQLFYRVPSGDIVGASVTLGPGFEVGSTRQLVPHIDGLFSARAGGRRHDRSPIDGRFLVTKPVVEERGNGIIVVLNWMSGLESRVPTG